MFKIKNKKRIMLSAAVAMVIALPAMFYAVNRLVVSEDTFALTYDMPAGYTTMNDPYLYDCAVRWFRNVYMSEPIPDTGLTDEQLSRIERLTCYGTQEAGIADTTGLEKMTNLWYLDLGTNRISSIDLSQNTGLTYLDLHGNQLTSIDVSNNGAITALYLYSNHLSAVDVSNNTSLKTLQVNDNQLTSIDVTHNTYLKDLRLEHNQLSSIDISNNTLLRVLNLDHNSFTFLDVSNNSQLVDLMLDNIFVKTAVAPTRDGDNYIYDFSGLGFMRDGEHEGFIVDFSIADTSDYSYDDDNMILTINNMAGVGDYIQIVGTDDRDNGGFSYKLSFPNILVFDLNGGTGSFEMLVCYPGVGSSACTVTLPATSPSKDGYNFLGWANSSSATTADYQPNDEVELDGDKTVYAVWEIISTNVNLSFDADGGEGEVAAQTCATDINHTTCDVTIPTTTPTRNGYNFLGWADSASTTTANYHSGDTITLSGDKTVYAVWKIVSTSVSLNFDLNGGEGEIVAQTCTIDINHPTCTVVITSAAPSKAGYDFVGWADSAEAATAGHQGGETIEMNANKTIYAIWKEAKSDDEPSDGDDEPSDSDDGSKIPVPDTSAPDTGANTMNNNGLMVTFAIAPVAFAVVYITIRYLNNRKSHIKFD